MNDAIQSLAVSALEYVPDSLRDKAGLQKQMVEDVEHIINLKLETASFFYELPATFNIELRNISSYFLSKNKLLELINLTYSLVVRASTVYCISLERERDG